MDKMPGTGQYQLEYWRKNVYTVAKQGEHTLQYVPMSGPSTHIMLNSRSVSQLRAVQV